MSKERFGAGVKPNTGRIPPTPPVCGKDRPARVVVVVVLLLVLAAGCKTEDEDENEEGASDVRESQRLSPCATRLLPASYAPCRN